MCIRTLFFFFCIATGIYHNASALKMVPAEDVCAQQGLQPGTPEYDVCIEQEQRRQAALIQAIMINEQAPTAQPVTTAVDPVEQTPAEPAPEPTLLSELSEPTEPIVQVEPTPALAPAEEKPALETAPTSPATIALQSITTKIKPQAATQTTTNECSGVITHDEFATIDGCMLSVEIDETGDAVEPTVFPPECAPSAEDMKHL